MSTFIRSFLTTYSVTVRTESMGCAYVSTHSVSALTRAGAERKAVVGGGSVVAGVVALAV